jgi:predicted deacylase
MKIGTATATPSERATGYRTVTELPTGQPERVPVVVVNGSDPGPTVWVTATIHGDEPTGIAAIHELLPQVRADSLAGTLVCVPGMNPAGLRTNSRTSYYHDEDPNRQFVRGDEGPEQPRVQQRINERIYGDITETADVVVSLHTSWVATYPYTIQPRVPYGRDRTIADAVELRDRLTELTGAFGLPVVNQFGRPTAEQRGLLRTLTGAAIADGIPAFTPELGGRFAVEQDACTAAVDGLWNVLATLEMVERSPTSTTAFGFDTDEELTRLVHPHTDTAGLVNYKVTEGDRIEPGQVVAEIRSPHGELRTEIESEHAGHVLSRHEKIAVYEGDPLLDVAVPDGDPLLVER